MKLPQLTAFREPKARVRGVAAGHAFRRLVGKALSRHFQAEVREEVAPANFGLCDRSGTEALAHMVQMVTGMDAQATVTCIDGVGAFDHVLRASIFRRLLAHEHLRELVPYVRAWYGTASEYVWVDDDGLHRAHRCPGRGWRARRRTYAGVVLSGIEAGP